MDLKLQMLRKKAIEDASSSLKEALKATDNEDIKKKTETVSSSFNEIRRGYIQISRERNQTTPDDSKNNDEGKKDDNVVDADFEEVKEENKEEDKEKSA